MADKYFRYIPNFDYVSRIKDEKNISDYAETKNLFRRARLNPAIFENLAFFTKYKVVGDERPDMVADKIYDDPNLDWLVLLCNNTINPANEWPLSDEAFDKYLLRKYGSYEKMYEVRNYVTTEVKDKKGRVVFPAGKEVPSNFSFTYLDEGTQLTVSNFTVAVTNLDYENKNQEERRNIFVLKTQYVSLVIDELEDVMPYKKGSGQYVSPTLVRGENIRLFN